MRRTTMACRYARTFADTGRMVRAVGRGDACERPWLPILPGRDQTARDQSNDRRHLVYLAGAGFVALGVALWTNRRILGTVLFCVLALSPSLFGIVGSSVYRNALTSALAVLILGLTLLLLYLANHRSRSWTWWLGLCAVILGLIVSCSWLCITRAETFWVFGVCALLGISSPFLGRATRRQRLATLALLAAAAAAVLVAIGASTLAVANINDEYYGAAIVDDFSGGQFPRAFKSWASVAAGEQQQWVLINRDQREAVYRVSSTARSLQPSLEIPADTGWKSISCKKVGVCDEYSAWLPWAMRSSAMITDPAIQNEAQFQAFFEQIADDIEAGCRDGRLTCGQKPLAVGFPAIGQIDVPLSARYFVANLGAQLYSHEGPRPRDPWAGQTVTDAAPGELTDWHAAVSGSENLPALPYPADTAAYRLAIATNYFYRMASLLLAIHAVIGVVKARRARRSPPQDTSTPAPLPV